MLLQALPAHAANQPDKVALQGGTGSLTYGELLPAIAEKRRQLNHTQVLGLRLENSIEWMLWDLAALAAGIVCVPLPPFFTAEQTNHIAAISGMDACVSGNRLVPMPAQPGAPIPPGTAKITFTSGTTGTPKGVCLPASGMEQLAKSLLGVLDFAHGERHLSVMPLAILLENVAGVYTALVAGAQIFIPAPEAIGMANPFRPDFAALLGYIARQRITSIILTPELLRGLVHAAAANRAACASLRYVAVGGATVPAGLLQAARSVGLPVYEGYGLSECCSVVAMNAPGDDHAGTVGRILPHAQLTISNGEVVVRNPSFLGYLGEPARNAAAAFATGDNGTLTDSGLLTISGRRKNTLVTSQGRNVAPEWLESVLSAQPAIAQAFVYGDGLPFPQALIVPIAEGADIPAAVAAANSALPSYAQLAHVDLVAPFTAHAGTLTPTGRLRRHVIAETYASLMKEKSHGILRHVG